jgi:superfamily II DNA or RNA helicase
MNNRDEILQEVLEIQNSNILLELGTGVGKSRCAIEKIKQLDCKKILLVIPRLVLINNWKEEFKKWQAEHLLTQVKFVTYVSLPKIANNQALYDAIIFDEAHHISERCRLAIPYIKSKYNILLSATIKRTLKPELRRLFSNLYEYKVSLKEAVENDILPEPRIILIPLNLETILPNEIYEVNKKKSKQRTITYNQWIKGKWVYLKNQSKIDYGVKVMCTQKQKYTEITNSIDYDTKRLKGNSIPFNQVPFVEQARKRKGLERLQWLAEIKSDFVKQLLKQLKDYRTLTFCYNIKQTEYLGKYCINSKNKKSAEYLNLFNNKKIKHLTACMSLNEGINLAECKCGIFANYYKSEVVTIQRVGRILRHLKPVIYLPYYTNTVEEDIVKTMISEYDGSLIVKASNPFNFNEYINR